MYFGVVELENEENPSVNTGVFGGVEIEENTEETVDETTLEAGTIRNNALPVKSEGRILEKI